VTGHLPIFDSVEHAALAAAREWNTVEEHVADVLRRHQTPATQPATMEAAPAAAPQQEEPMSLITDVEEGYAAVKAEVAKLEGNLPAALEVAKKLEGNPLVAVALKAAEHAAAGLIPPEALAYLAGQFGPALEGLLGLYNPQGAAAPPAAQ
jgi:hypothetical protein